MRISDWSSDVCSSDLLVQGEGFVQSPGETLPARPARPQALGGDAIADGAVAGDGAFHQHQFAATESGAFTSGVVVAASRRLPGVNSQCLAFNRSEEHTSELQSLMRISYAVFCLKKKNKYTC